MSLDPKVNFGIVVVSVGYNSAATAIALTTGMGALLPNPGVSGAFNVTWWNSTDYADPASDPYREIVRVTARSLDALTVVRAQEGTTGSAKNIAGKTYSMSLGLTAKDWTDVANRLEEVDKAWTAGGTANALTITPTVALPSYTGGIKYCVIPTATNTGAATLAVSGLAAKNIFGRDGAALRAGAIQSGVPILLQYDGTQFVLLSSETKPKQQAWAWVNFNGTGVIAIRDSFNVQSLTDNGTGDYTVTFATAAPDVNYAAVGSCSALNRMMSLVTLAAGSCRIAVGNTSGVEDQGTVCLVIFR